jgi:universal stress protein E
VSGGNVPILKEESAVANKQTILVVLDPTTEAQPAFSKAAEFAKHIGANLEMLVCLFDPDIAHVQWVTGTDLEHLRVAAIDAQFEHLEQLAEPLRSAGQSVSCRVVWDNPRHEAIVREAIRVSPDFVVKDTHHHSAISRALFTNTDWHLIRECPFPLWLVKPGAIDNHATVMAAIDPTHEHDQTTALDHQIIQTAQLFSVMFEERLHLAHVFEPPPPLVTGPFVAPVAAMSALDPTLVAQAREAHANELQKLAADIGFPAEQVHLRDGNQVDVLPEMASDLNANIVVMGSIARSRLDRVIVGHTAEKTLELFPCDVVIVKPEGFKSPIEAIPPVFGYLEKTG